MKLFILVVVGCTHHVWAGQAIRYDDVEVYRITPKTGEALERLQHLENGQIFRFWESPQKIGGDVKVMVPPHLKDQFHEFTRTADVDTDLFMSNLQDAIDSERPAIRSRSGFGWTDYHTLDEIYAWLKEVAQKNPDTVTLVKGGSTYEGRDILGVHVSFSPDNQNKAVFLEGNIHANEWISSAVVTWVLNEILTSTDPAVRQVAESHDWYVFPVVNPDGFVYSHTHDRTWRKTRVPYLPPLCYGADPNRNWGYHWNDGGSSQLPCTLTYAGPKAFSEPCTKTLSEYISSIGSKLQAYIGFHSYSQKLLIPYGHTAAHLDNFDDLLDVGKKAVQSLSKRYGTEFVTGNIVETMYTGSGGSMDWVKGTYKTPITYTYELRDKGRYGFLLPSSEIVPSGEEILDSLVTIFQEFDKKLP